MFLCYVDIDAFWRRGYLALGGVFREGLRGYDNGRLGDMKEFYPFPNDPKPCSLKTTVMPGGALGFPASLGEGAVDG